MIPKKKLEEWCAVNDSFFGSKSTKMDCSCSGCWPSKKSLLGKYLIIENTYNKMLAVNEANTIQIQALRAELRFGGEIENFDEIESFLFTAKTDKSWEKEFRESA